MTKDNIGKMTSSYVILNQLLRKIKLPRFYLDQS